MIVVRDIFHLKFGQSKEAIAIWKQLLDVLRGEGFATARMLTDLAGGRYYTVVLETSFDSLTEWEKASKAVKANKKWRAIYEKLFPLTESGRREILSVVP